jgi:hypothetical protein
MGRVVHLQPVTWQDGWPVKGTRVGLFSFNETNESGSAAFNWFTYNYDGPKGIK